MAKKTYVTSGSPSVLARVTIDSDLAHAVMDVCDHEQALAFIMKIDEAYADYDFSRICRDYFAEQVRLCEEDEPSKAEEGA